MQVKYSDWPAHMCQVETKLQEWGFELKSKEAFEADGTPCVLKWQRGLFWIHLTFDRNWTDLTISTNGRTNDGWSLPHVNQVIRDIGTIQPDSYWVNLPSNYLEMSEGDLDEVVLWLDPHKMGLIDAELHRRAMASFGL